MALLDSESVQYEHDVDEVYDALMKYTPTSPPLWTKRNGACVRVCMCEYIYVYTCIHVLHYDNITDQFNSHSLIVCRYTSQPTSHHHLLTHKFNNTHVPSLVSIPIA